MHVSLQLARLRRRPRKVLVQVLYMPKISFGMYIDVEIQPAECILLRQQLSLLIPDGMNSH